MKNRSLQRLIGLVVVILGAAGLAWAVPTPVADPAAADLDRLVVQILEVQQKKLTLNWLADPRSKVLLADLLKTFPDALKKNFKANITGAYKKTLLGNFDAKLAELNLDLAKMAGPSAALADRLLSTVENVPFPFTQGFTEGVKRLDEMLSFQMAQRGTEGLAEATAAHDRAQNLLAKIGDEAGQDPYPALQAIYGKKPLHEIPIWWYDDAQHDVGYVTHGEEPAAPGVKGRKKWTVLVFLNADNDLEASGLADLNEMEQVGSDGNLNIVVQIDRQKGSGGDTIVDGNWIGTRRYEIVKERTKKIASRMVMNLGERDMGNKRELAEFLQWGVETYPADHYVAVIWNHGAGWKGISSDDESGNMMTVPDVLWGCRQAIPSLQKVNPNHPKFDIIDFDACLMGMVEVAYELRDVADFLLASEETEPGQGMPYQDTLRPLKDDPAITPRMLAKAMIGAYVKSYAAGGSQTTKRLGGSAVTKAAYDLSRIAPLADLVGRLGASLAANHAVYTRLLVDEFGTFAKVRRYSDESFVDLFDLAKRLALLEGFPEETRAICQEILLKLGYPKMEDRLSQPVVIRRRTPGVVIWGYNGWKTPPKEIRPAKTAVYHSRFCATPLAGPDDKGDYACAIGPFQVVIDPVAKKREYVREINYRIQYQDGKTSPDFTARTGREYTLVTQFPATSPLVAEGHTQGMGNSYGISVYYPYCLEFRTSYKTLQFARDFGWDEFIARIPAYTPGSKVLVTGGMVEDIPSLLPLLKVCKALGVRPDILWDPKVFGYRFPEILAHYRDGVVLTDSVSVNSFGQVAPSADDLIGYLEAGGRALVAAQSIEQQNTNSRLLEEFFRFRYVEDDKDLPALTFTDSDGKAASFSLNGEDSVPTARDVTIMECDAPAQLFVKTADGRGAGIAVAGAGGKAFRAVYLGFRFEAVDGEEVRTRLLGTALRFLDPTVVPAARPAEPPAE
ncbi:MAG: hypothetical protein GX442_23955 [Candidatus Riflebacteria bacterium]|nr:hypothetical protein [Candidatus Riflebacteria bacterium]